MNTLRLRDGVVFRPARSAGSFMGLPAPTVCRHCRRQTAGTRSVIEHYDATRGEAWAEHEACAHRTARRDWLTTEKETPWRLP